jgi:aryl-alcohol dehydrogenase-like predicted oxidoreductase
MSQAAIQFILSEPSIVSVLPNIYDAPQLAELAAATDTAPLSASDLQKIADLYANDFYLDDDIIAEAAIADQAKAALASR